MWLSFQSWTSGLAGSCTVLRQEIDVLASRPRPSIILVPPVTGYGAFWWRCLFDFDSGSHISTPEEEAHSRGSHVLLQPSWSFYCWSGHRDGDQILCPIMASVVELSTTLRNLRLRKLHPTDPGGHLLHHVPANVEGSGCQCLAAILQEIG